MLTLALFMILLGLLLISAGLSVVQASPVSAGRHHHVHARQLTTPVSAGPCCLLGCLSDRPAESSVKSDRVSAARRYLGATARQLGLPQRLWCADFVNLVERRSGRRGTGSRLAKSFSGYGRRLSGPAVGAIAVMSRRGGGHVGVVSGVTASGDPIVISGNHGRRVAESVYPRGRILAYVDPQ
ncbi:MAG: TIGR02594 family protein [Beijerinckiaceae bacterium]|nr:TIGR02594 family protein [Beijerinckiaceae bacterium]